MNHTNPALLAGVLLLAFHQGATAAITLSGDNRPDAPVDQWRNVTIGNQAEGYLIIDAGSTLSVHSAYVGLTDGAYGTVNVLGNDSLWFIKDGLNLGHEGRGELNIRDGASVDVGWKTVIAVTPGASGRLHLDNGTLTTESLYSDFSNLAGRGSIYTQGLIADDIDLVFDAMHGTQQTITLNSEPDQNIEIHLDQTDDGNLGVGYGRNGTLSIRDGIVVNSYYGYVGYDWGDKSTMIVSGSGSTWNTKATLHIGRFGEGSLTIADGGTVNVKSDTRISGYTSSSYLQLDNGTLNTNSLFADIDMLTGVGTINAHGFVVGGYDLIYDADHGLGQSLLFDGQPGQAITLNISTYGVNNRYSSLGAGYKTNGSLTIRDGMTVSSDSGYLGYYSGAKGIATVSGVGSTWYVRDLTIGEKGWGILNISDGGFVVVEHILTMNSMLPGILPGTGQIRMSNSGMLALEGNAGDSLADFFLLFDTLFIDWDDAFCYWDNDLNNWTGLTGATLGEDYTLEYFDTGDLAGYTVLTVHTPLPEPNTAAVLWLGLTAFSHYRRGR